MCPPCVCEALLAGLLAHHLDCEPQHVLRSPDCSHAPLLTSEGNWEDVWSQEAVVQSALTTCVFLYAGKVRPSSEDRANGANQATGEVGNSSRGKQWSQMGVFVVSGAAAIGKSSSAEHSPHTHTHTII